MFNNPVSSISPLSLLQLLPGGSHLGFLWRQTVSSMPDNLPLTVAVGQCLIPAAEEQTRTDTKAQPGAQCVCLWWTVRRDRPIIHGTGRSRTVWVFIMLLSMMCTWKFMGNLFLESSMSYNFRSRFATKPETLENNDIKFGFMYAVLFFFLGTSVFRKG